jgi:DNA-binding transcriptional LysR family regulator
MAHEFETRQLRHIVTLARSGKFSSAARALGLSQPALTRSIQAVEREAGVLLFDRHARGVTPTPVGELVVARATELLAGVADLHRELDLMRGVGTGTLRIGAGPAMRHRVLPTALAGVSRRHPRLDVRVRLGDWQALARALLDREIDIMLGERSEAEGDARFEIQPLPNETGVWYANPDHPLLADGPERELPLSALAEYTLALPSLPERLTPILQPLLGDKDRGRASVIQCDDLQVLKALALRGNVIALLAESIAGEDAQRGHLVALRVKAKMPTTYPGAIWLRGRSLSPAGEALLAALEQ